MNPIQHINYLDENALWAAFRKGKEDAFQEIYTQFSPGLMRYGLKFTTNEVIIAETIQNLFVKLWKNRSTIGETASVKNYLYKSYRRLLIEELEPAAGPVVFPITEDLVHFNFELSHDQTLMRKERQQELQTALEKALAQMSSRQREIIYLRFYEDLSHDEIAELLNITTKGTYKLLYRALDSLREYMSGFSLLAALLLLQKVK